MGQDRSKGSHDGDDPDVEILVKILKLGSFINTPMKDGVCDPAGIGQTELKIVMALAGEGALAGHDLSEIMGVAPMNVSRALSELRKLGWIEEAVDPANRRRKPVRLSTKGRAAYERLAPQFASVARSMVGSLSKKQRIEFAKSADLLIENMTGWITCHHRDVHWKP